MAILKRKINPSMQIRLINKGSLDIVSGGYLYNKQVFEGLQKRGYSICYTDQFTEKKDAIDIVDSLVIVDYMRHHSDLDQALVLIHQIPGNFNLNHPNLRQLQFIVTGKNIKNELIKNWNISPQNIKIIEPGIETNWQVKQHYNNQAKNILMVANYLPKKGYELLLPILKEIKDMDWHVTAYGNQDFDPNFFYHLNEQVKKSSFSSKITLNSPINHTALNQAYVDADILLHCSENETYGMVVAEAIQTQLPCIIYRTGNWEGFETTGWAKVVHSYQAEAFAEAIKGFFLHPKSFPINGISPENNLIRTWGNVVEEVEELVVARHF